jgi:hypothetical protein
VPPEPVVVVLDANTLSLAKYSGDLDRMCASSVVLKDTWLNGFQGREVFILWVLGRHVNLCTWFAEVPHHNIICPVSDNPKGYPGKGFSEADLVSIDKSSKSN